MSESRIVFRIADLGHHYPGEERPALSGFSLEVREGDRVAILGISGSGKTTVLNAAGLLEDVRIGSLIYFDSKGQAWEYNRAGSPAGEQGESRARPLDASRRRSIRRRDFAFVMQDAHLWHYLSGLENSVESLILAGHSPADARKKAQEGLLPLFPSANQDDIRRLVRKTSPRLSGGQRTRMAIGRALVRRPRVLFLDEPNASSDPVTATNSNRCIRACLDQSAATVFLVSHRYEDALELGCDRFLFLEGGRIKPVSVNGRQQNELPSFEGISRQDLENARDGRDIAVPEGAAPPAAPPAERIEPRSGLGDIPALAAWRLHAVLRDLLSPRSRLFALVIGVVSFFAALSYCLTSGLASATVAQLQKAIESEPDFRNILVTRRPLAGSPQISQEEIAALKGIAGVEGVYSLDAPGLLVHWDGRNPLSGLSGRCLEKGDPEAARFGLYYPIPEGGAARFCCAVVLNERAFRQAKEAGAVRTDASGAKSLAVYKTQEDEKRQLQIDERLELPIVRVADDKELPYADFLLPWEFGLAYGGQLGARWHRSWALCFARPDGSLLRRSHSRMVRLEFECLGLGEEDAEQVRTAVDNVRKALSLENGEAVWDEGQGAFLLGFSIPKGRDFWPEDLRDLENLLRQTLPEGIELDSRCVEERMDLEAFPQKKLDEFRPCRLSVYVRTLDDLWPAMQEIAGRSLWPQSRHLRSLAVLRSIGGILTALLWITLALFSFFGTVAIGSSSMTLVERNRGEIGISLGFGTAPRQILAHYLAVGVLSTVLFGILAFFAVTLLESLVVAPVLAKVGEHLDIPLAFGMGMRDYLLAVCVPVLVTVLSIALPTAWNIVRFSPATLLRARAS